MRILQIAKYYPPMNSAQALQAGKVTKALLMAGFSVNVIAGTNKKKPEYNSHNVIYLKYSDRYFKGLLPSKINRAIKELNQISYSNTWVKQSVQISENIILEQEPDLIFTQSTPFDCHLVGLYLKKKFGLKWITAFSDPYPISIAPYPYQKANRIPFLGIIQRRILKQVIKYADKILVSSKESYELMCNFTQIKLDDKYCKIPHIGIELDDSYDNLSGDGWLIYTGKLTKERSINHLLLATKECIRGNEYFKGIKFIGKVNDTYRKEVYQMGLEKNIQFFDEIEQSMVREAIKDCSGLILIEANMEYSPFLPSKFADYATLLKPILAIVPERSQVSEYLSKYGGGIVCGFDLVSITNGINQLVNGRINGSLRLANYFSNSNVSHIYSEIFQSVIKD